MPWSPFSLTTLSHSCQVSTYSTQDWIALLLCLTGSKIEVKVVPQFQDANPDIAAYGFEKRKCLYGDEIPPGHQRTLFKKYSPSTCTYENSLDIATKMFECTPWDIPGPATGPFCDGPTARDFKIALHRMNSTENTGCQHENCSWS